MDAVGLVWKASDEEGAAALLHVEELAGGGIAEAEGNGAITDGGEVFDRIRRVILAGDEGLDVAWGRVDGPGDEVRRGALLGEGGGLAVVDEGGILLPGGEQRVLILAGGKEEQQGGAEQTGKHAKAGKGDQRGVRR